MEITLRDRTHPALRVIETLLWLPGSGLVRGTHHLARAERTCLGLGFAFDAEALALRLRTLRSEVPLRLRLSFGRAGDIELSHTRFDPGATPALARVALAPERLDPADPFLRIKTTRRALYDRALATKPEGLFDLLFLNRDGALCEGAFTNVFLRKDGRMLTPALSCGLLPGILRETLLLTGEAREAVLTLADLEAAEALWVGNSLRGLIPAELVRL